ncbi:dipeptide/oligopeptide/nickel ABC transporter permease/ATP-binding protein [Paenibacillus sp. HWE-109]|uniref:dipeptide/oligopeptide/nickel ABC transporter permease/ATP-binding protein n=1 Tax=Paenibacillus sp. HWE-109 TaxID=1306526 RepID=UPI001EE034E4|nr:dipeptide/oligopeptide/nickel ABC transporter permease/ATP-binding protein [Paenibacillus sp. HWE-109]UKS27681.1 dipeptide/oligopeptide/nickel ABC transporter permease/ATP-binding protein [Paenibacillus sp. HWE-109]
MDKRFRQRLVAAIQKDPIALGLLVLLIGILIVSLGAPWFAVQDPLKVNYSASLLVPSSDHWFGTDNYGRDVWTRLMYGGLHSIGASILAVSIVISISLLVGLAAGYFGGWVDTVLTRIMDVLFSFPQMVLAITLATLLGAGLPSLLIAVAAVSWPSYARMIRSYVLSIRGDGYVTAARAMGIPAWKIIGTHILGALAGPILVLVTLDMGSIMLSIASMSFLGLGIKPPQPEWGAMLNEGRAYLEEAPWLFIAPGMAILLTVLAANYLGDILKDALEPRKPSVPQLFGRRRLHKIIAPPPIAPWAAGVSGAPILDMRSVTITLQENGKSATSPILHKVDLRLYPGECLGLVGESGSGKSTLALASLGLLRLPLHQQEGSIQLFGEDTSAYRWKDWRRIRGRRIAYITQDPMDSLNPVLRIGEQLRECLLMRGSSWTKAAAKEKVLELLEQMGLSADTYGCYPHELSGGMRQRVVIAMAMIHQPDIIVADEPTTALDVSTQARIMELLNELRLKHQMALIFISHDLRLVAQIADRVCVMRGGQVVETGDIQQVFTNPAHAYTRQLLDAIPKMPSSSIRSEELAQVPVER